MIKQKLPIGIDCFEKLIREDFYYVDKTSMISELLSSWSEVNLFTRPRRFGKSLFLSMLYQFFDIDTDKSVFDGLKISEDKSLCEAYMGKYPVIFIVKLIISRRKPLGSAAEGTDNEIIKKYYYVTNYSDCMV